MMKDDDFRFPAASPLPAWLTARRKKPAGEFTPAEAAYLLQRRAMDFFKSRRFAAALPLFEQCAAEEPENVDWLFMAGLCRLELRDCQAALATFDQAERLAPGDPEIRLLKADTLLELREYDRAGQLFTQLLASDLENPRVHFRFASWAALTGKPRRALAELRRLIAEDAGFRAETAANPAFAGLRSLPAFRKLIAAPPPPGIR